MKRYGLYMPSVRHGSIKENLNKGVAGIIAGGVSLCFQSYGAEVRSSTNDLRPNILMIISDDQGYGDFSCFGNSVLKTPNLDRLYTQSVRLVNYCVSPLCAPTRAAVMTGRHEYFSGVSDTYGGRAMLREDAVTIPMLLKDAGYRTGFFNKWHLGNSYPSRPQDKGFEHTCEIDVLPGLRSCVTIDGQRREVDEFHDDVMTDDAIRFIKEKKQPFFAYVASKLPHDCPPPMAPDKYVKPYLDAGLTKGDASVYGMVANLDHNIGRILATLDEEDLAANTIVIFFSDNGPLRNCPELKTPYESSVVREYDYTDRYTMGLRGGKTLVYEGGIHVPCFVRWPGHFEAGRDVAALTAHVDWLPTLLEIAGAKRPSDLPLDGRSIVPLLTGTSDRWDDDRALMFQSDRVDVPHPWVNACVRTEHFKLVNRNELYDLTADPSEKYNVAEHYAAIVKKYQAVYDQWYAKVFHDTDGFEPSYTIAGSDKEMITSFTTAQLHSVTDQPHDNGWRIKVARSGRYKIEVSGIHSDWFGSEGALIFRFGKNACRLSVKPDEKSLEGSVWLDEGTGYFTVESCQLKGVHTQLRGIQVQPGFDAVSLQYSENTKQEAE